MLCLQSLYVEGLELSFCTPAFTFLSPPLRRGSPAVTPPLFSVALHRRGARSDVIPTDRGIWSLTFSCQNKREVFFAYKDILVWAPSSKHKADKARHNLLHGGLVLQLTIITSSKEVM